MQSLGNVCIGLIAWGAMVHRILRALNHGICARLLRRIIASDTSSYLAAPMSLYAIDLTPTRTTPARVVISDSSAGTKLVDQCGRYNSLARVALHEQRLIKIDCLNRIIRLALGRVLSRETSDKTGGLYRRVQTQVGSPLQTTGLPTISCRNQGTCRMCCKLSPIPTTTRIALFKWISRALDTGEP